MYQKFCVIFPNFTPPTQGLFVIQLEQFQLFHTASMLPAKYQPNPSRGSGEEIIWMVFTIYGHGGHLEFWIMTDFRLVLYIHHIYGKYEISLKFTQ